MVSSINCEEALSLEIRSRCACALLGRSLGGRVKWVCDDQLCDIPVVPSQETCMAFVRIAIFKEFHNIVIMRYKWKSFISFIYMHHFG